MKTRKSGLVLSINTSFPTVEGVPGDDVDTCDSVASGKTKTAVGWPDNWHLLSPKWRAAVLALLVKRVIEAVLSGGSPTKAKETFEAFKKLTGWGSTP